MVLQFAWRYFKGKKSAQAIQVISWVSIVAMGAGTAALIIVLSVFNGFEGFIKDLYSNFYPELKITATEGKTFIPSESLIKEIEKLNGIRAVSKTLEEKVLFTFHESQVIATIKGIDSNYEKVTAITDQVKYGSMDFSHSNHVPQVVLGIGVSNKLGATEETHVPITCYTFKTETGASIMDIASSYTSELFEVTGVYVLQEEIDAQYVFAPLGIVADLIGKPKHVSSIEISLNGDVNDEEVRKQIVLLQGTKGLKIETRYEQNKTLYFILKSERLAVYSILTLMLIIASFNIVGSMSMLVIDKQKDISILKAMGMHPNKIRQVFVCTGILLSLVGAVVGCFIALIICLAQQYFGLVKLGDGGGSFLIEAYPVKLHLLDFVLVLCTVVVIGFLASLFPAIAASKKTIELRVK